MVRRVQGASLQGMRKGTWKRRALESATLNQQVTSSKIMCIFANNPTKGGVS